ncbi:MAG: hypothetical protein C3F11_12660 [Methylocystaceae bacterium]|nr:MAG: hypothetical protein C3F11_12660 [Methylocystaceae bacterium]
MGARLADAALAHRRTKAAARTRRLEPRGSVDERAPLPDQCAQAVRSHAARGQEWESAGHSLSRWELSDAHKAKNAASPENLSYEEEWFDGVHSNMGGGYPDTGLSDVALEWMAERTVRHGSTIDLALLDSPAFRPNAEAKPNESQTLGYRVATMLFVKIPSLISKKLLMPLIGRSEIRFRSDRSPVVIEAPKRTTSHRSPNTRAKIVSTCLK